MALAVTLPRPLLRGYVHLASAVLMPGAMVYLLVVAESAAAYAGAAIFGSGLLVLFSVSAAYHLVPWPTHARRVIARIDHSTIFVAIAACYTPFCLQTLPAAWGIPILTVAWTITLCGVALKVTWLAMPRWLGVACYLAAGWLALVAIGPLWGALDASSLALLAGAGALFSLGALAYATRWPNPWPRFVGHHEVFHLLVSAATFVLYGVVAFEVLPS